MQESLSNFLDTLCTLTRLLHQEDLMGLVDDGGGGYEDAELVDLISGDEYDNLVNAVRAIVRQAFERAEMFKMMYNPFRCW